MSIPNVPIMQSIVEKLLHLTLGKEGQIVGPGRTLGAKNLSANLLSVLPSLLGGGGGGRVKIKNIMERDGGGGSGSRSSLVWGSPFNFLENECKYFVARQTKELEQCCFPLVSGKRE